MLHVSVRVNSVQVTSFDKLVEHSTSALEQYGVWFPIRVVFIDHHFLPLGVALTIRNCTSFYNFSLISFHLNLFPPYITAYSQLFWLHFFFFQLFITGLILSTGYPRHSCCTLLFFNNFKIATQ